MTGPSVIFSQKAGRGHSSPAFLLPGLFCGAGSRSPQCSRAVERHESPDMSATIEQARLPAVSLSALFLAFLQVSLGGFGGGLVWVRRMVVDRRRLLSEHDFAHLLRLCTFLPGAHVARITVCVRLSIRRPT